MNRSLSLAYREDWKFRWLLWCVLSIDIAGVMISGVAECAWIFAGRWGLATLDAACFSLCLFCFVRCWRMRYCACISRGRQLIEATRHQEVIEVNPGLSDEYDRLTVRDTVKSRCVLCGRVHLERTQWHMWRARA